MTLEKNMLMKTLHYIFFAMAIIVVDKAIITNFFFRKLRCYEMPLATLPRTSNKSLTSSRVEQFNRSVPFYQSQVWLGVQSWDSPRSASSLSKSNYQSKTKIDSRVATLVNLTQRLKFTKLYYHSFSSLHWPILGLLCPFVKWSFFGQRCKFVPREQVKL